jgi:hypothetical protein
MHGSPLLRTIAVTLLLLLMGIPMWRMTHEQAAASVVPTVAAPAQTQSIVHLAVAFAAKPSRFTISYLGQPIWDSSNVSDLTAQKDVAMIYPKEGVDLEYSVTWPPGTQICAARLSVAANDAEPVEKTLWGSGQIDDVLTFP